MAKRINERRTLNDRMVAAMKPAPAGERYDRMDTEVKGFGVRVTDKCAKTFFLRTRYPGHTHPARRELGRYGEISLAEAREKALLWRATLRAGKDPALLENQQAEDNRRRQSTTFGVVAEDYFRLQAVGPDDNAPLQRQGLNVRRDMRRAFMTDRALDPWAPVYCVNWTDTPITDITSHDVRNVIECAVAEGGKYHAHNLLSYVRRLFNWAIDRDAYGLEQSPCERLKAKALTGRRVQRKRILSDDELRAFWPATKKLGYPYGPLLQILTLTIQRKSQVAEAPRAEFDLQKRDWVISAERMKMDAAHLVPLTAPVVAILEGLPLFNSGDHLFSTSFGRTPVNGFGQAKERLDRLMLAEMREIAAARGDDPDKVSIPRWTIHDLRRTGRTHLSALPVAENVRELVIAHAKLGLHRVYDRFEFVAEKRHALELWAARLLAIVEPAPDNVVRLHAKA